MWREGTKLPNQFQEINSILNSTVNQSEAIDAKSIEKTNTEEIQINEEEEEETFQQDLISLLVEITEELDIEYISQNDLENFNNKLVEKLKLIKEKDFDNFSLLFDQIINLGEKAEYFDIGLDIYDSDLFFQDEAFAIFNLRNLMNAFIDNNTDDEDESSIPVKDIINNFHTTKREKSNTDNQTLSPNSLKKLYATDNLINQLIEKININNYDTKQVSYVFLALVNEGNIESANTLLDKKIEQVLNLEEDHYKFNEIMDLLELSAYASEQGLINSESLSHNNEIFETNLELASHKKENLNQVLKNS